MTDSPSISGPLPPRLSMDQYADFVEDSLGNCDPARVARQKELEERIRTPFRMVGDTPIRPPCVVQQAAD
jgi:hypothetical protein